MLRPLRQFHHLRQHQYRLQHPLQHRHRLQHHSSDVSNHSVVGVKRFAMVMSTFAVGVVVGGVAIIVKKDAAANKKGQKKIMAVILNFFVPNLRDQVTVTVTIDLHGV